MVDSFSDAAGRHRADAKRLASIRRFQNAGHLVGFAAECLTKEMLENAGITIDKKSGLREHFPRLGNNIYTTGHGRVMGALWPIIQAPSFLNGWRAELRYEADLPSQDSEKLFRSWSHDVEQLFTVIGR